MNTLFQSPRFWGVVAIAVFQVAVVFNWITSEQGIALVHIVQAALGGVVGIATLDRNGDKKVEAAMLVSRSVPAYQMSPTTGTCNHFASLGKVTKSKKH